MHWASWPWTHSNRRTVRFKFASTPGGNYSPAQERAGKSSMRCLFFDLAACTRPKVQMMQRSRLLSCSNVHDVEPCAFFLACRAVSWRALGILGRRACILSSPSHFCHCASTRSIRNRSSAYIPSLSRRTAPSDSKTQRFLFALSFVRFHPTGARESLRVAAG